MSHAELLHGIDVRPVIQFMGRNGMFPSVPGEEHDLRTVQRSLQKRRRRRPERSLHELLLLQREMINRAETASSDDAQLHNLFILLL